MNLNKTSDADGIDEISYFAVDLYNNGIYVDHIIVKDYENNLTMTYGENTTYTDDDGVVVNYATQTKDGCYIKFFVLEMDTDGSTQSASTYVSCEPTNYAYAPMVFDETDSSDTEKG